MVLTAKKPVILVIDDDARIRELFWTFLSDQGYDVCLSEDGFAGLDDVKQLKPDLVLLDLRLPGRPGEEVCKAIRDDEDERIKHTPILMVTGKVSDVDRVIGMVIGADGYLPKPFPMSVLLKEVRRCLDRRSGTARMAA
jgi:DNA-binding response OmpR family regulator